jgi:uncharacterized protein DUF2784
MLARFAADAVLLLHLTFIAFVVGGALLAFRWRWMPWIQLPAAAWGAFVELSGSLCPLTGLENALRARAGQSGYRGSFVEHYLLPLIYPAGLSRDTQFVLAGIVVCVNLAVYAMLLRRTRRSAPRRRPAPP